MKRDEEYLDEKFPKGETKFRGEAMVLLALSRLEGKKETLKQIEELIDFKVEVFTDLPLKNKKIVEAVLIELGELKQELNKLKQNKESEKYNKDFCGDGK